MLDSALPSSIRQRIGDEASLDFSVWIEARGDDWKADVFERCTDRFGRMLAEELAKVRVELGGQIVGQGAALRQEMAALGGDLRQEMGGLETGLRQDMVTLGAALRQEMGGLETGLRQDMVTLESSLRQETTGLGASLRQEMAATRVDVLRWAFLFWLGQIAAIAALLSWTH